MCLFSLSVVYMHVIIFTIIEPSRSGVSIVLEYLYCHVQKYATIKLQQQKTHIGILIILVLMSMFFFSTK